MHAGQTLSFPQRNLPGFCDLVVPLSGERAQGKPGANRTRSLACKKKAHERSHHRLSQSFRLSPRNGVTASFVLSPVSGLSCHRCHAGTGQRD